eukprot:CAMPEP_0184751238 /NCGR_PEP_ID=MMETSP0315-20130426/41508_1 /TAXON_ID=101924 /ORGANISM="Rhodosorus marinus, Strain UTEX LB 2760" /LENGTH=223 /DNA_ID=CAMNT_0027230227 /DNA_START=106 /DNA_END=777 /DNA_ORIENTATION=-
MELGVKRRPHHRDCVDVFPGGSGMDAFCRENALRVKRNVELEPLDRVDMDAVLKEGMAGFEKYALRCAVLRSLGISRECARKIFIAGNCKVDRFLMLIDLNARQEALETAFREMEATAVQLHSLNLKSLSISLSDNRTWIKETCERRVPDIVCQCLVSTVIDQLFDPLQSIALTILYGDGVRDRLIPDWCNEYGLIGSQWENPTFIIIRSETGRRFYVPAFAP